MQMQKGNDARDRDRERRSEKKGKERKGDRIEIEGRKEVCITEASANSVMKDCTAGRKQTSFFKCITVAYSDSHPTLYVVSQ